MGWIELAAWGACGGFFGQYLTIESAWRAQTTGKNGKPKRNGGNFNLTRGAIAVAIAWTIVGGIITVAQGRGADFSPWVAIQIGLSAPMVVTQLARVAPEPKAGVTR